MNKSVLGVIVAVLAVGGIFLVISSGNKPEPAKPVSTNTSQSSNNTNNSQNPQTDTQPTAPNTVTIKDFSFQSAKITVKKGTTVTWTNQDEARHDITPDNESADFMASKLLKQGESYSFTFNKVGIYTYKCSPHPYMKASVEVVE